MKIIKTAIALSFLLIFHLSASAQDFEGKIAYSISYGDLPEEMKAYESMLPKEMNFSVKGDKSKMTQPSAMGSETIVITDNSANKSTVLIDAMGNKIAVSTDLDERFSNKPKVEYVAGTKKIAGYDCKKAILTDENGIKTTLWYTPDVPALDINLGLSEIDGLPLEFESEQNGINAKIVAKSVSEEKINDSEFVIPAGYKEMSAEEFQQLMKSQGGGM